MNLIYTELLASTYFNKSIASDNVQLAVLSLTSNFLQILNATCVLHCQQNYAFHCTTYPVYKYISYV